MPSVGDLQINVIANAAEFQDVMGQVKSTLVQVGATTQTTLGGQTATAAAQGSAAMGQLSSQTNTLAAAFAKMRVLARVFGLRGRHRHASVSNGWGRAVAASGPTFDKGVSCN